MVLNRFFVSPEFSVSYRRAKQLVWQNQATSGYSLLAALKGQLDYNVDSERRSLTESESLVLEPNTSVIAKGRQVELIFLTFSASLVLQHAATMKLIPPKSVVTFTSDHLHGDQRLDSLLSEFMTEVAVDRPGKEIVMRALVEQTLVHIL